MVSAADIARLEKKVDFLIALLSEGKMAPPPATERMSPYAMAEKAENTIIKFKKRLDRISKP